MRPSSRAAHSTKLSRSRARAALQEDRRLRDERRVRAVERGLEASAIGVNDEAAGAVAACTGRDHHRPALGSGSFGRGRRRARCSRRGGPPRACGRRGTGRRVRPWFSIVGFVGASGAGRCSSGTFRKVAPGVLRRPGFTRPGFRGHTSSAAPRLGLPCAGAVGSPASRAVTLGKNSRSGPSTSHCFSCMSLARARAHGTPPAAHSSGKSSDAQFCRSRSGACGDAAADDARDAPAGR